MKLILYCLFFISLLSPCPAGQKPVYTPAQLAAQAELKKRGLPFEKSWFFKQIINNYPENVRLFIEAGFDQSVENAEGDTPIMLATTMVNINHLNAFIKAGGQLNVRNRQGRTALMHAAWHGKEKALQLLIKAGADVNLKDAEGKTALQLAEEQGFRSFITLLLNAGAKLRVSNQATRHAVA